MRPLQNQAKQKGITLQLEPVAPIPPMQLNATAIKLVIGNLVENAIKYSPEQSVVEVRMEFSPQKGLLIQVLDDGPGIPEAERQHIFDRFYRGENAKRRTKGMGLGLYTSRTLLALMGGTINVLSNGKKGSCFTVTLPGTTRPTMHQSTSSLNRYPTPRTV